MGNFVQDDRSKSQSITMTVGHLGSRRAGRGEEYHGGKAWVGERCRLYMELKAGAKGLV